MPGRFDLSSPSKGVISPVGAMMRSPSSRRAAEARGRFAEGVAAFSLRLRGWTILGQRVRTGAGELDLVAVKGRTLAFVEVKARARLEIAADALGPRQRERLLRAASLWRSRHGRFDDYEVRFDLILVAPWRWPRHIKAAFTADTASSLDLI